MKKLTTGQIFRLIKEQDNETIIRRTNMRTFCEKENLDYTICQERWLINLDDFLKALNPKQYKSGIKFPRLRTKIGAQKEWNSKHKRQKIKHFIIDKICDSGRVFVYKHGRYNIINYDELEVEIKKELERKKNILDH